VQDYLDALYVHRAFIVHLKERIFKNPQELKDNLIPDYLSVQLALLPPMTQHFFGIDFLPTNKSLLQPLPAQIRAKF
jgi:hypothetical protein